VVVVLMCTDKCL